MYYIIFIVIFKVVDRNILVWKKTWLGDEKCIQCYASWW